MAKLMLIGNTAKVEITRDPLDGDLTATCVEHSKSDGRKFPAGNCDWSETYDDLSYSVVISEEHADGVR
jgi:hypothetical protein